jgi:hypothetical protein
VARGIVVDPCRCRIATLAQQYERRKHRRYVIAISDEPAACAAVHAIGEAFFDAGAARTVLR